MRHKMEAFSMGFTCRILIVIAVLLVPMQASAATFSGQVGRIAFSKAGGGLWSVLPTGSKEQQLSSSTAKEIAWSPDGTQVAFTELRKNGNTCLRAIHVHTGTTKNLTYQPEVSDTSPVWSYDGSRIAFVRTAQVQGNTLSAVFTIRIGEDAKNVTGWSVGKMLSAPSWAPDNKRLVYQEVKDNSARLLIKDLTNGQVRELTKVSDVTRQSLAWSPNGQKVLFNDSEGQVYTIRVDGTHRAVISDGDSYKATWSPDGSRIAFLEELNGEYVSISEPDGSIRYIRSGLIGYDHVGPLVWSPDGTQLVFTATQAVTKQQDLFSIAVAGSTPPFKVASGVTDAVAWQSLGGR